jgi:signal transduction histidine kinase
MGESYSRRDTPGAARAAADGVSEPRPDVALARELLARLFPEARAERLLAALLAERSGPAQAVAAERREGTTELAARELRRVRAQLALGEAARTVQHAINNPLTALLAEVQLLELEPLSEEHRRVVGRLVELVRRVAAASRRLDESVRSLGG